MLMEGKDIPYWKFEYQSLEDMIKKIPGLYTFQKGNQWCVKVIPTKETAHIANLVQRQKRAKKKPNRKVHFLFQNFY